MVMTESSRWRPQILNAAAVLLLATLTIVTYAPVLSFDFVDWDDPGYVTKNSVVQNGLTPEGIAYAWTTFDMGNWIPLTWLSLELDATLFGVSPAAFHATNVLWHAVNACLVYVVLRRFTGAIGGSLAVAALFAVHPLHVESVAWISERKDVLSTFWLLIALLAYAAFVRRPAGWRMVLVGIAMALGLLAKSMLVTLPLLLLLLDVWPLRRVAGRDAADSEPLAPQLSWQELVLEKRALFVLAILDGLITIVAQQSEVGFVGGKGPPGIIRLGNAIHSCGWYLWKTVWPTGLCVFYPHPMSSLPWWEVGMLAIALGAVSAWAWIGRCNHSYRLVGWLWFLIALLPVIGLLQVGGQAHADRYTYVPHLGLFLLIVWEAQLCLGRVPVNSRLWLPIGLTAFLVGACAFAAREQMESWRSSDALWIRALQLDPDHPMAHLQLASRDLKAGNLDAAEARFRRVLFLQPQDYKAVLGLAQVYDRRGEPDQAAGHYAWVLRLNPLDQFAAIRLAALRPEPPALVVVARPEPKPGARGPFRAGLIDFRSGRTSAALQCFLEAVQIDPNYADAHNNAALALKELGRKAEARSQFEAAVALAPDIADFRFNLAVLLEELGETTLALEHFENVSKLSPSDPEPAFRAERLKRR